MSSAGTPAGTPAGTSAGTPAGTPPEDVHVLSEGEQDRNVRYGSDGETNISPARLAIVIFFRGTIILVLYLLNMLWREGSRHNGSRYNVALIWENGLLEP